MLWTDVQSVLCERGSSKYVYLGCVGFEYHMLNASHPMFNATAGEHYGTGKWSRGFEKSKPDLGQTYSVLDHNYTYVLYNGLLQKVSG